jgi:hypothetical protein
MVGERTMDASAYRLGLFLPAMMLGACTVLPPNEPSVMVLPGEGKSFDQFRADNEKCKQFAFSQGGGATPQSNAVDSGALSAMVGTILGAAAGAAIDGSQGAAAGAGAGLVIGGLSGTWTGEVSAARAQQRYDIGYQQCMYASGHRIPMSGGLMSDFFHRDYRARASVVPPPPPPGVIVR